jgi:hypothetical protein
MVHEPEVGVSSPADLQPAPKAIASERDRKIAEALNLMIEEARAAGEEAADDERPLADLARIWHGCRLQTFIGSMLSGRRESNPRSQFGRPCRTACLAVHLGREPDCTVPE